MKNLWEIMGMKFEDANLMSMRKIVKKSQWDGTTLILHNYIARNLKSRSATLLAMCGFELNVDELIMGFTATGIEWNVDEQ